MYEVTRTTTVQITNEDIDDIMVTAFEGGINHWCERVYVNDWLGAKFASELIALGGTVHLKVDDEYETRTLTRDKLLQALVAMPEFDLEDYDANDADNLIQTAVFGEVVYG